MGLMPRTMGLELGKYTKLEFARVTKPGSDNLCVCTLAKAAKGNPVYLKQFQHTSRNSKDGFSAIAARAKYIGLKNPKMGKIQCCSFRKMTIP